NLRVPYLYAVLSNRPRNIFPILGDLAVGTAGKRLLDPLVLKLVDEFGLPIQSANVQFRVVQGGGKVVEADAATDIYGIAGALVDLGSTSGDQIFNATAGGLTATFRATALAEPKVGGIVNGASFAQGKPLAPGSIASIFGSDLAEAVGTAIRLPLPLALFHVSVSFDHPDSGASVPGRLFFVSPTQVNVQVPWELAGLPFAMVKVRINDTVSGVVRVELSDNAPGIFDFALSGQRFGVVTHANGQIVTPSSPALRGETVIVYATGVGPVDQPQATGEAAAVQPSANPRQMPTATVGGRPAAVLFSGLAPFFAGLNQINLTIPNDAPTGAQPLILTSNGVDSNTVNVSIQ